MIFKRNDLNIGILTYHDGPNHGAFLQAFSLMRILQKTGNRVQIINYKNKIHNREEGFWQIRKFRRPVRFIDYFQKYQAFRKAHRRLDLTAFTTNPQDIRRLKFDLVVCGSDVIWNYKIFGYDDLYFGGVNAKRRIAYAGSFGWVNSQDNIDPRVGEGLKRFNRISVRDTNSQRIIKNLLGYTPPLVVDPTFLYDFNQEKQNTPILKPVEPYLLVYSYAENENATNKIRDYARKHRLKTLAVGYRQSWCDRTLMNVGPFEWIDLFKNADAVATSTYHGTIFSLKYRKNFFLIKNQKAYNRVSALLNSINIGLSGGLHEGAVDFIPLQRQNYEPLLKRHTIRSNRWLLSAIGE